MTQRLVWTTHATSGPPLHPPTGLILPERHIDHSFSLSSLCSLFICPPRALTQLATLYLPRFPSCWKASWCSALLNQQHIKVKSAGKKKKRFPAKVQLPHHVLLSPLKRDRLHSRCQKGGSRDSKIVIINISVVWLDLAHVCMDRDWSSWALWWSKRIQGHFVAQSLLIFDISCLGLSPFKQSLIQSCRSASFARPTITFKVDKSWRRRQNLWTGLSSNSRQHFCICFYGCRPAFDREKIQK